MTTIPMKKATMPKKEPSDAPLAPTKNVAAVAKVAQVEVQVVTVSVPYVNQSIDGYDGDQCRRCDLGLLTSEQLRKLRAIRRGYVIQDRKLTNGSDIKSMADAVRALLDSISI